MTQVATSELMTVSEVADTLRVDDTTVRRWIKSGLLEAVTLPHLNKRQSYRVRRETLNKITNENHHSHHNHHKHEELEAVAV
jgi:excisionase family DNA binding protein